MESVAVFPKEMSEFKDVSIIYNKYINERTVN